MNPFSVVFGKERFFVSREDLEALLNLFLEKSVSFSEYREEEGGVSFSLSSLSARRVRREAAARGIELRRIGQQGLPAIFLAYRRRWGLILGVLCALMLLVLSTRVLWDVRVVGNETIPTGEIETILREGGLYAGRRLSEIRAGEMENRILIATDRLSWVSINLHGTVAEVQVLEAVLPEKSEGMRPANLVAARDGQIELLQLYRGAPTVKIGQAVRAGELLVSGISDSQREGFRYTRAAGVVLARTEREITVTIPFAATVLEWGDERVGEVTLRFFDFSAKIFKRTGNREGECAIIKREYGLEAIGLSHLPFSISAEAFRPVTEREVLRTPEEVVPLAFDALEKELSALSPQIEILEKRILPAWSDDGLTLTCTLSCIEDIAKQVEFDVLP